MARNARLALPQHVHVVADGEVLPRRQGQDAQPRVFRCRTQKAQQTVHEGTTYKNMFMCASEKHETLVGLQSANGICDTHDDCGSIKPFRGALESMVEGFFKHLAGIR